MADQIETPTAQPAPEAAPTTTPLATPPTAEEAAAAVAAATTEQPPEATVAPAPVEPQEKPLTAAEFAALSEMDRKNWQLQQDNKRIKAELESLQAGTQTWQADPVQAFLDAGGTVDELTSRIIDGKQTAPMSPEVQQMQAQLEAQAAELEAIKNAGAQNQRKAYFTDYAGQVDTILTSSEDYQQARDTQALVTAIRGMPIDMASEVGDAFDRHHKETGKTLTPAEIAGMMVPKAAEVITRLQALPVETLQRLFGAILQQAPATTPAPVPRPVPQTRQPVTNNAETASQPEDLANLSHEERMKAVVTKHAPNGLIKSGR